MSQIHYDSVRNGKLRENFTNLARVEIEDTVFSEQQRQFFLSFIDAIKLKSEYGIQKKGVQDEELHSNSLYDTTQHLLFSNYLMTCLNARE
jgi:hypothetical protein